MSRLQTFVLVDRLLAMVQLNLLEDKLLVLRNLQAKQFKVEIEVTHRITRWFVIFKVQSFHVRMSQCLVNRDSTGRIKSQHTFNQIYSVLICTSEEIVEILSSIARQLAHKCAVIIVLNLIDKGSFRLSNQVGYHHHLFLLGLGGKKRLTTD